MLNCKLCKKNSQALDLKLRAWFWLDNFMLVPPLAVTMTWDQLWRCYQLLFKSQLRETRFPSLCWIIVTGIPIRINLFPNNKNPSDSSECRQTADSVKKKKLKHGSPLATRSNKSIFCWLDIQRIFFKLLQIELKSNIFIQLMVIIMIITAH